MMVTASREPMQTVFNHIPKTGGTSVRRALAAAIGTPMAAFDQTGSHPWHRALIAQAGNQRLIASHLLFYPGERLAPGWYYATTLRDPLSRFLSQYHHYKRHREQVLDGTITDPLVVAAVHKDLSDYLADPDPYVRRYHTNWQARYFAARMCVAPDDLSEDQLLAAAIESLEDYDLVGVSDDLQGFFDVYCRDLALAGGAVPKLNVTLRETADRNPSPALRDIILTRNRVDAALHQWAVRRFARDRQRGGPVNTARSRRALSERSAVSLGDRQIEILAAKTGRGGSRIWGSRALSVEPGGRVNLTVACRSRIAENDLTIGFAVQDFEGQVVFGTNTRLLGTPIGVCRPGDFKVEIEFSAPSVEGEYEITLALHKGLTHLDGCYHWREAAARFRVAKSVAPIGRIGRMLRSDWRWKETPSACRIDLVRST